ncbi:MAG TPA: hypothetical protein VFQ50_01185 [Flavobacterium sp.]|jgi:hypothetical protein|nr:hypothetical protein [Flavobacterium sp.]
MKKLKNISKLVMLFGLLSVFSCSEVEPLDPAIVLNPNPTDPNNPNNPGNPGTSTGDYWPAELNNQWVFERNGVTQQPMKMVSINSIDGHTYYTFASQTGTGQNGTTGSAVTRLRKEGADYYMRVEEFTTEPSPGVPGSVTTGTETIILRDDLPVGGTWTSSYNQTTTYSDPLYPVITINYAITGTIMEKGVEVTVGDVVYTDVIKSKFVQNVTMMGQTQVATTYYWFAKDIGPIRMLTESDLGDYDSLLVSYIVN